MKSMLIIGLGRFGRHLALKLSELGNEVMIVDQDEECVNKLMGKVTQAQIGDCMDEDLLRSLGIRNFDVCFVCISENFQASLEITSLLKENGARLVVAKADRDIHAKFLLRNGADEVIYPERDMANRAAVRYSARNAFDYIELNVRSRYNINIIATKKDGRITPISNADYVFKPEDHLIIAGNKRDSERLLNRK